ncbi:hypothetical protein [Lactococcus lactis]|uniref:hypothetical protein n=1 Tax=Lactococcus lactis TaxID=1358 RepID=UPI0018ABA716|nr:hypothetical protein [Lactococcus lactis]
MIDNYEVFGKSNDIETVNQLKAHGWHVVKITDDGHFILGTSKEISESYNIDDAYKDTNTFKEVGF